MRTPTYLTFNGQTYSITGKATGKFCRGFLTNSHIFYYQWDQAKEILWECQRIYHWMFQPNFQKIEMNGREWLVAEKFDIVGGKYIFPKLSIQKLNKAMDFWLWKHGFYPFMNYQDFEPFYDLWLETYPKVYENLEFAYYAYNEAQGYHNRYVIDPGFKNWGMKDGKIYWFDPIYLKPKTKNNFF